MLCDTCLEEDAVLLFARTSGMVEGATAQGAEYGTSPTRYLIVTCATANVRSQRYLQLCKGQGPAASVKAVTRLGKR